MYALTPAEMACHPHRTWERPIQTNFRQCGCWDTDMMDEYGDWYSRMVRSAR